MKTKIKLLASLVIVLFLIQSVSVLLARAIITVDATYILPDNPQRNMVEYGNFVYIFYCDNSSYPYYIYYKAYDIRSENFSVATQAVSRATYQYGSYNGSDRFDVYYYNNGVVLCWETGNSIYSEPYWKIGAFNSGDLEDWVISWATEYAFSIPEVNGNYLGDVYFYVTSPQIGIIYFMVETYNTYSSSYKTYFWYTVDAINLINLNPSGAGFVNSAARYRALIVPSAPLIKFNGLTNAITFIYSLYSSNYLYSIDFNGSTLTYNDWNTQVIINVKALNHDAQFSCVSDISSGIEYCFFIGWVDFLFYQWGSIGTIPSGAPATVWYTSYSAGSIDGRESTWVSSAITTNDVYCFWRTLNANLSGNYFLYSKRYDKVSVSFKENRTISDSETTPTHFIATETPNSTISINWQIPSGNPNDVRFETFAIINDDYAIYSVCILNRDCLDSTYDVFTGTGWIITEVHYYHVQALIGLGSGNSLQHFSWLFWDIAGNEIAGYIQNDTYGTLTCAVYPDAEPFVNVAANGTLTQIGSTTNYTVDCWFFPKRTIIDCYNVGFWCSLGLQSGQDTGWVLELTNYFNIYSMGGLNSISFVSGDAGAIDGGDWNNLYADNCSDVESEIYWRNLVHIKMLATLAWSSFYIYEPVYWEFGISWYVRGKWVTNGLTIRLTLVDVQTGADAKWAQFECSVYTFGIYDYYSGPLYVYWIETQNYAEVWIDIWFNKANDSAVIGARIGAYYYAVSNYDFWRYFTGGSWSATHQEDAIVLFFAPVRDYDDSIAYSHEIEMIRLTTWLHNPRTTTAYMGTPKFKVFDYTFGSDMSGIQTPEFDEPRVPSVPLGGLLGILFSAMMWLFTALSPAFSMIWSGIVYVLDGVLQFLFGQPKIFTSFVNMGISIIVAIISFMVTLALHFVDFVTVFVNTVFWFFTYFFNTIWGIINFFVLSPVFNIFSGFAAILGISYAWLGGTIYIDASHTVWDFSYLHGLSFMGLTGGIAIFGMVFVAGFFFQLMLCFITASLDPILVPIGMFWGFVQFIITVIQTMYDIINRAIHILIAAAHALRDIAPRPFGF